MTTAAPSIPLADRFTRLRGLGAVEEEIDNGAGIAPETREAAGDAYASGTRGWLEAGTPELMTVSAGDALTAVARAIEEAPGRSLALYEPDLAPGLRCRSALTTLRRRADRRGKTLTLHYTTPAVRALADAAGWRTEKLAPSAVAVRARREASWTEETAAVEPVATPCAAAHTAAPKSPAERLRTLAFSLPRGLAGWRRGETTAQWRRSETVAAPRSPRAAVPASRAAVPALRITAVGKTVPVGIATAGVTLAAIFFVYPSANVAVVPASEPWSMEAPITVDPNLKKADVSKGLMPGRTISRELSETASAPATGRKTVPDGKAGGDVVLLNRSDKPVSVPKGTVVLAGAVKFATTADVTVAPSRTAGTAQSFGMAGVKVQAVTGGASGNVERNTINKIEGPLSASLTVQNNVAMRGGSDRATTFVTEDDRKKLQDSLYKSLSEKLKEQIKGGMPAPDKETVVQWAGQGPAVVEASFNKAADEEAQSVSLTLKLRYGATVFSNEGYNDFIKQLAKSNAQSVRPGFALAADSVNPEPPSVAGVDAGGTLRLIGRAKGTMTAQVDRGAVQRAITGKSVADAHAFLATLPGATSYALDTSGVLPGRMPPLGWRIGVTSKVS